MNNNIADWIECAGVYVPVFEPSIEEIYFQELEELEELEQEINFAPASEMEVF